VAPAASPAATEPAQAPAAAGIDRLSLHFSADCWIEVKDRDDKVLVATLKHADDKLQVEGRGPFKVLLGYAPGVEMAYNGAPVKVDTPPVGNRSTRLIVGNS
jgi:cytoskeleton protein RodZ